VRQLGFPKGTVHLIGVDIDSIKRQHIAMQWNDSYFIFMTMYSMLSQVNPKIVSINIHDCLPSDASGLDVFVKVAYCQRRFY
jgi:hypothetical protein